MRVSWGTRPRRPVCRGYQTTAKHRWFETTKVKQAVIRRDDSDERGSADLRLAVPRDDLADTHGEWRLQTSVDAGGPGASRTRTTATARSARLVPRMKLCHESDGAARDSIARATTASSDELFKRGGGSMHIDGCATISAAATPQRIKSIFITS